MFEGLTFKQLHARRAVLADEREHLDGRLRYFRAVQFDGYRVDPDMIAAIAQRRDEVAGELDRVDEDLAADRNLRREAAAARMGGYDA